MASNAVVIDVPSSGALDRMVAVEDEPSHVAVRRAIDVYSERRERIERRGEERIFDDPVVLAIPQFTRDAVRVLLC